MGIKYIYEIRREHSERSEINKDGSQEEQDKIEEIIGTKLTDFEERDEGLFYTYRTDRYLTDEEIEKIENFAEEVNLVGIHEYPEKNDKPK